MIKILKIKKIKLFLIISLILINLSFILYLKNELSEVNLLKITFFDIGQGDAALIKIPGGYKILVDAGSGNKILNKIKKELPFYNKTIDLIIPTHPDSDHIGGFLKLLDQATVKSALISGNFSNTKTYQLLLQKIKNKNIKIIKPIANTEIIISSTPLRRLNLNSKIKIINPFEDIELKGVNNDNNYATSFILIYGDRKFLFTSDIESLLEKKLLKEYGSELNIDVLKVAHHGSKTSSTKEFIKVTSPGISIIQVGKNNPYSHPHQETIQNLKPSIILRNDERGDITLYSDGKKIWVK